MSSVSIQGRWVGDGQPCYLVAEIGINHNGSLEIAKQLIDLAKSCGCDAVKFQKRTPDLCVPKSQWDLPARNPLGNRLLHRVQAPDRVRRGGLRRNRRLLPGEGDPMVRLLLGRSVR